MLKGILKGLLSVVTRFVDSDGDGKVEFSDLPGTLAKLAAGEAQARAVLAAIGETVNGFKALAGAGQVTVNGVPITAEDVAREWAEAKVPFTTAADEARANIGK